MDNDFISIFGLPFNDEIVEIDETKIYGLALFGELLKYPQKEANWFYYAGSFLYLFGIYKTIQLIEDLELVGGDGLQNAVFFELDNNCQPIKIVIHVKTDSKLRKLYGDIDDRTHNIILRDLTFITNTNCPKVQFDVNEI
jgi:hypothetical protein